MGSTEAARGTVNEGILMPIGLELGVFISVSRP